MSDASNRVAAFNRWDAGCYNYPNQSLSGQDFMFGGFADYGQEYPCPNGLGLSERNLSDVPAWRERIDTARKFIAEHKLECSVRVAAGEITKNEIEKDIESIKEWLTSLFNHQFKTG